MGRGSLAFVRLFGPSVTLHANSALCSLTRTDSPTSSSASSSGQVLRTPLRRYFSSSLCKTSHTTSYAGSYPSRQASREPMAAESMTNPLPQFPTRLAGIAWLLRACVKIPAGHPGADHGAGWDTAEVDFSAVVTYSLLDNAVGARSPSASKPGTASWVQSCEAACCYGARRLSSCLAHRNGPHVVESSRRWGPG